MESKTNDLQDRYEEQRKVDFDAPGFREEAEPLMKQLHALSVKYGVPAIYAACISRTTTLESADTGATKNEILGMTFINGARAPLELRAAYGMFARGLHDGAKHAMLLALHRDMEGGVGESVKMVERNGERAEEAA